jgi:hypothetical protein
MHRSLGAYKIHRVQKTCDENMNVHGYSFFFLSIVSMTYDLANSAAGLLLYFYQE